MSVAAGVTAIEVADGHCFELITRVPDAPRRRLLWLPAMGVPARHYLPFADALAARGIAVGLHEWRGIGSSNLRAGRACDWGYRELLADIACSDAALEGCAPGASRIVGGHSLGGQLACCHLALQPDAAQTLWLVASGAPYWRVFPPRVRYALPPLYRFMAWIAHARGALPGRRLGFAGNESRGVIADWTRSGLRGQYSAAGLGVDLDAAMGRVEVDVRAAWLHDDWLGPPTSLRFLLSKLGSGADAEIAGFDARDLGTAADHFAWMRTPAVIAAWLADA